MPVRLQPDASGVNPCVQSDPLAGPSARRRKFRCGEHDEPVRTLCQQGWDRTTERSVRDVGGL